MFKSLANGWKPGSLAAGLRQKRLDLFIQFLSSFPAPVRILDIGGQDEFWKALDTSNMPAFRLTFLNIFKVETSLPEAVSLIGDARDMREFADRQFDVAFSNSVIEHVGGLREQYRMASECRRVAKGYFVQTPNRYFPMEPHFLVPGFQFLPQPLRAFLHSRMNLGWWKKAASYHEALEEVESIRLLSRGDLRHLFPEANLWEEKLGGLAKSFVAHHHDERC